MANVFQSGMKYQIDRKMGGTNIVTVDGRFETVRHQVHLEENEPIELQHFWSQGHDTQPL